MTQMATRATAALTKVPNSTEELDAIIEKIILENKPEAEGYSFEFSDEIPEGLPVHAVDQLLAAKREIGESAVYLLVYMV